MEPLEGVEERPRVLLLGQPPDVKEQCSLGGQAQFRARLRPLLVCIAVGQGQEDVDVHSQVEVLRVCHAPIGQESSQCGGGDQRAVKTIVERADVVA